MKASIHAVAPLFLLILLGSCSKEKAEPTGLNNTKWRLTAQTREGYIKGSSSRRLENTYMDCSGKNIITFTSAGQVLWVQEKDGCTGYNFKYEKLKDNAWGQWQLTDSPRKLSIRVASPQLWELWGYTFEPSILPVSLDGLQGPYDVVEVSSTTLILSRTYTMPTPPVATQDSVYVFQDTFTRVAE